MWLLQKIFRLLLLVVAAVFAAASSSTLSVKETPIPAPKPVLQSVRVLSFGADWCKYCVAAQPAIDRLIAAGHKIQKVDIDSEKEIAQQYSIRNIPTFVLLENDKEAFRTNSVADLEARLKNPRHLGVENDSNVSLVAVASPPLTITEQYDLQTDREPETAKLYQHPFHSPKGTDTCFCGRKHHDPAHSPNLAEQMRDANNRIRNLAGKPSQTLDERLCKAAQDQADYCAARGYTYTTPGSAHFFGGTTPDSRAARHGFHGDIGENMAGNRHGLESAFEQWQESPGHAITLYGNYDRCGFGMATSIRGENLWFAVYGREGPLPQDPHDVATKLREQAKTSTRYTQPTPIYAPPRENYINPQPQSFCAPGMPCYQPQQRVQYYRPQPQPQPQPQRRGLFGRR